MAPEPIDLDAARAKRGPVASQEVILGGKVFTIPARLTVELGIAAGDGDLGKLITGLFGEQAAEVLKVQPPLDVADLLELVQRLAGGPGNLRG